MAGGKKRKLRESALFWCIVIPTACFSLLFLAQLVFRIFEETKASLPAQTETPAITPSPAPTGKPAPARTPAPTAVPQTETPPMPTATPYVRHYPVTIYFTRAKLSSTIHSVGKVDGAIGTVDSATDCAWYNKSAVPREDGNCIINGHDRWGGETGTFAWLKKAKRGDEVAIELDNGDMVYYIVTEKGEYPYDDFPKYHLYTEGDARLTLITCKGDYSASAGTSLTRVVVVCEEKG